MEIVKVCNKRQFRQFLQFPQKLYSADLNYISPLITDITNLFKDYQTSDQFALFISIENAMVTGRIAVFHPVEPGKGGIGFFECVDAKKTACALFDKAIEWLYDKDIFQIVAPVNRGQRDKFWGLLQDARMPPLFQENYQPPYYRNFFEHYGFQLAYKQFTYAVELDSFDANKLKPLYERSLSSGVSYRFLDKSNLANQVRDLVQVYNDSWRQQEFFIPLEPDSVLKNFKAYLKVMDPNLVVIAYKDQMPVGIFASLPELNPYLRNFGGKFTLFHQLLLLIKIRIHAPNSAKGLVFGIIPGARNKGIEAGMIYHIFQEIRHKSQYKRFYLSWIGDFNQRMMKLMDHLGAEVIKVHHTYAFEKFAEKK